MRATETVGGLGLVLIALGVGHVVDVVRLRVGAGGQQLRHGLAADVLNAEQLHGARAVGGDVVVQIVKITHMLPSRDAWAPLGFLCRHYNTPRAKCKAPIHRGRLHKHCRRAQKIFLPQIAGFSLQAAKMLL